MILYWVSKNKLKCFIRNYHFVLYLRWQAARCNVKYQRVVWSEKWAYGLEWVCISYHLYWMIFGLYIIVLLKFYSFCHLDHNLCVEENYSMSSSYEDFGLWSKRWVSVCAFALRRDKINQRVNRIKYTSFSLYLNLFFPLFLCIKTFV